jgi:Tol biopolymer transport system component
LDVDGADVARLTDDDAFNGAAAFSPDGRRVAFHAESGSGSKLMIVDVDGSNLRVLYEGGWNWYPRWSPDGRWIVFTAQKVDGEEGDLDVMAVPADASAAPITLVGGSGREAEGRWRPAPPAVE